eukprot:2555505-Rhodomonas_salina.1
MMLPFQKVLACEMDSIVRRRHYFGIPVSVDKNEISGGAHDDMGNDSRVAEMNRGGFPSRLSRASTTSTHDGLSSMDVQAAEQQGKTRMAF